MDDTSEKARRNLMAFSLGIIAVAWLEAPLTGNLFGAVVVGDISPIKAWVAALLILAYLSIRFHLSPHIAEPRNSWGTNYLNERITYLRKQIDLGSRAAIEGRQHSLMIEIKECPPDGYRLRQIVPEAIHGRKFPKTSVVQLIYERKNNSLATADIAARGAGTVTLSWLNRWQIHLHAIKQTLWMKWDAIEVFFPYALGAAAGLISIFKLLFHLFCGATL